VVFYYICFLIFYLYFIYSPGSIFYFTLFLHAEASHIFILCSFCSQKHLLYSFLRAEASYIYFNFAHGRVCYFISLLHAEAPVILLYLLLHAEASIILSYFLYLFVFARGSVHYFILFYFCTQVAARLQECGELFTNRPVREILTGNYIYHMSYTYDGKECLMTV
jgi:hypothetical protein